MNETIQIPFGLADITIGEGAGAVSFNGKDFMQVEGGEVTLTPTLQPINFADFGESTYDEIITGYTGSLTFSAGQDDLKVLQVAMSFAEPITDTTSGDTVGLMDAKIGTSLRSKAKKVTIHPRIMGTDTSKDIVLYKMASNGDFTKGFANSQGSIPVNMNLYPRDGFDVSKPGNFFYIGSKDPNVTT